MYHSLRRSVYDWVILSLLLAPLLLGIGLFGGVAMWTTAPMIALLLLATMLTCLRPLVADELKTLLFPPGTGLFFLFWVYALCAIPFAAVRHPAGIEALKVGSFFFAYWAWCQVAGPNQRWRIVFGVFLLTVSLICWYALILHSKHLPVVLNLPRPEGYGMRASGTYICPNHFAHLLEMAAVLGLGLLLLRDAGPILRILSGYTLILALPVLVLTQSRSGWLGAAAGLCVTGCIVAAKRSRRMVTGGLVAIPLLLALLAGGLWVTSPMVRDRVLAATSGEDGSVGFRLATWKDTITMIKEAPLFGYGAGSYEWVYPRFRTHRMQWWFDYAHNEFLHCTAEYGLVGTLLLGAAVGWGLFRFLRLLIRTDRPREVALIAIVFGSVAASLVHGLFDFNLHIFANVHVLLMIVGIAAARLFQEEALVAQRPKSPAVYAFCGGVLVAAALHVPYLARVYLSHRHEETGKAHQSSMAFDDAQHAFEKAIRADKGFWKPYRGLADVSQTLSVWSLDADDKLTKANEAFEYYRQANALNPYDLDAYFGQSRIHEERGDTEQAIKQMDEILARAPRDQFYLEQAALQRKRLGRPREALRLFEKAHSLGPTDINRLNIRQLRQDLKD